jgi:hypothetical protein
MMQSITNAKSTAAAGGNNITGTNFTACRSTPSGSSNTESCTTSFSPTNGRTLIVHVYVDMSSAGSPTISCTDGEGTGNTYVNDGSDTPNNSFNNAILRLQSASGSGAYTITCQLSAAGTGFIGIFVREYTGFAASPLESGSAGNHATGTNPATNNITTANANDVVISACGSNSGVNTALTIGNGYTAVEANGNGTTSFVGGFAEKLVTSTGTQTDGWTYATSTTYGCMHIAYKST